MPPIDFRTAVLERSAAVPVVVDFWAPWCGPCRVLGPALEDLAAEAAGRWDLVKVNVDEQPDLAHEFGIQGIPAVKMFRDGRVVGEFLGALPAAEIRRWLDAYVPDPDASRLDEIAARWPDEGPAVAPALEAFLAEHPGHPTAKLRLAQALVGREPQRARDLLRAGEDGAEVDADVAELIDDVGALAELMDSPVEAPARLAPHLEHARAALREHDLEGALDALIDAAMVDKTFADELPRRAAVALFRLLGQEHPLTREHQRRLAMALHS